MLHHQDQFLNAAYGGAGNGSASSLRNRKCDKDNNFNFLPGKDNDGGFTGNGGDENRNQVRPRNLTLGRDPPNAAPPSLHPNPGLMSPRARLPCWSPLEPLPEIETGDDGFGRVPPDGAEERRMEEEEGGVMMMMMMMSQSDEKKERQEMKGGRGGGEEDDDEWGDSDSESESGGSVSSLNMESGGEAMLVGGWDRVGVGEPRSKQEVEPSEAAARRRSFGRRSLSGSVLGNVPEERSVDQQSSDSDGELMDAVWTLRDRERFKAQEMEKHQVQLTMYRRLALIRWVRTLQARIQEQQNRLQSSFDVILDHRKELLRMGAASAMMSPAPTVAVGQS